MFFVHLLFNTFPIVFLSFDSYRWTATTGLWPLQNCLILKSQYTKLFLGRNCRVLKKGIPCNDVLFVFPITVQVWLLLSIHHKSCLKITSKRVNWVLKQYNHLCQWKKFSKNIWKTQSRKSGLSNKRENDCYISLWAKLQKQNSNRKKNSKILSIGDCEAHKAYFEDNDGWRRIKKKPKRTFFY